MQHRSITALLLLPCAAALWPGSTEPQESPGAADLAALMPEKTLVYVEAPALAGLLEAGLEHPFADALLDAGLTELVRAKHGAGPAELLARAGAALGVPLLPSLAELSAGGAALGIGLDKGQATTLLALRGQDEERQRELVELALEHLAARFSVPGAFRQPARRVHGAPVWNLGEELSVALAGSTLWVASKGAPLEEALALALGEAEPARALAGVPSFQAHARGRSAANLAYVWADLARLEAASSGDPSASAGYAELRAFVRRPEAQLVFGPGLAAASTAEVLTGALRLEREDLALELFAEGVAPGPAAALLPPAASGATGESGGSGALRWSAEGADTVLELALYRDLAALFRERVELFPAEALPGFAEASSNLALFLGGLDAEEDLLPGLGPWVRLVVRPVDFADDCQPEMALPAAAAIVELEDPELGPALVGAFQTGIGIANVDRAQRGLDALVLSLSVAGDVEITSARFRPPRAGDGVDLRYNLEPACAVVGDVFVVGTHKALVRELALGRPAGRETEPRERLTLDGRAVAGVIAANSEALVMQNMLAEGSTRERAEGEIGLLLGFLERLGQLDLDVRCEGGASVVLGLRLDLLGSAE